MSAGVQTPATVTRPRGRPRSTERHHAILESTRALLAGGSYEQLTIEAIASAAGVSKQTVYKWWPSKAAVVTEAVMAGYFDVTYEPLPDTGDIQADLRVWLYEQFAALEDPTNIALLRAMTAAAAEVSNSQRIYEALAMPTRRLLLERLSTADDQSRLRPGVSLVAAVDAIVGTLLLRTLSYGQTSSREGADALLDLVLQGILRPQPRRK